jgi:methionyl-tRNA synthetase
LAKNNSELLNNLGNFINRALAFCEKNLGAVVPTIHLGEDDAKIIARINQELKEYEKNLEKVRLRDGIVNILNISRVGNQYMQAKKPWELVKGTDEDKLKGATVIGICVNIAYLLSIVVYPYMPNVSNTIRRQLNVPEFLVNGEKEVYSGEDIKSDVYSYPKFYPRFVQFLKEGHAIGKPEPLFKRVMDAEVKEWKEKFGGQQQQKVEEVKEEKKSKKQLEKEKKAAKKLQQQQQADTARSAEATSTSQPESNQKPSEAQ